MEERKNLESTNSSKKKILIIILVILAIAIVALIIASTGKNNQAASNLNPSNVSPSQDIATPNQDNASQTGPTAQVPTSNIATQSPPAGPNETGVTAPINPAGVVTNISTQTQPVEPPIEKTSPITLKVEIGADGFVPASFDVKAGQEVTLSITSTAGVAIVVFDGGLSASAIGIGNGQTKDVKFTAPVKRGTYFFHNDVPGKNQTAKIIVK